MTQATAPCCDANPDPPTFRGCCIGLSVATCLLFSGATTAADSFWSTIQLHGFAAQSVIKTSDNRFFGDSPDTSFASTEIGVNASVRLDPKVLVAGQVLARRAGDMYDGTPSLDYALTDIALIASPERILGIRLGRVKNPLGLYNETRDVPFTRPGIFLPQVIYYDKVRNIVLSSDGAAVYGSLYNDLGEFSVTLVGGWPVLDDNVQWTYLGGDFPGTLRPNGSVWTGSLWYATVTEQLRFGLSGALASLRYAPHQNDILGPGQTDIVYGIASLQYSARRFTLSTEYGLEPVRWRRYGPLLPRRKVTSEGYYLQGTYRIRSNLEFMACYEEGVADRDDRDGSDFAGVTGGLVPAHAMFSKIVTVGLRWDPTPNLMLRAQYQWNQGTLVLSQLENPDFPRQREYWNLLALQVAFRF